MSAFDSFLVRAVLAGLGVALAAAPLGCFVVWRRMAYFGDATAHAAILGVALALGFSISVFAGALATALVMAIAVTRLGARGHTADTLLGVLAHSSLALGLVVASLQSGIRVDLTAYLFGDILSVGKSDLAIIWAGAAMVLGLVWWRWTALLTATVSPDLAQASGIDPKQQDVILTVSLALVVAVAIKVVGALLIGALLIIPAATARAFSSTPERMALIAACLGATAALGGLWAAYRFDTPAGPSIVSVAAGLFLLASLRTAVRKAI